MVANKTQAAQETKDSSVIVELSNEERKKLDEIITSNIVEIDHNGNNKVSNAVIQEIFSENIDVIVNEIERYARI